MKTLLTLLTIVTLSAGAQTSADRAPANYLKALNSDNHGLVFMALFHSVTFKLQYPEQNTDQLLAAIRRISREEEEDALRYCAFLAAQYLERADLLAQIGQNSYKDPDQFFNILADTLQRSLLVSK